MRQLNSIYFEGQIMSSELMENRLEMTVLNTQEDDAVILVVRKRNAESALLNLLMKRGTEPVVIRIIGRMLSFGIEANHIELVERRQ